MSVYSLHYIWRRITYEQDTDRPARFLFSARRKRRPFCRAVRREAIAMCIAKDEIKRRQMYLRYIMAEMDIDALCIGASAQIDARGILRYLINYYLPAFEEYLVIPRRGPVVFFPRDGRGADYAMAFGVVDEARPIPEREYAAEPAESVAAFLREIGCKTVGTAWGRGVSSAFCLSFQRRIGKIVTKDLSAALARMRMIKSPAEIALVKEAAILNEAVLERYLENVAAGRPEREALGEASRCAVQRGAEDLYWMTSSSEVPGFGALSPTGQRRHIWRPGDYHYAAFAHSGRGGYFSEVVQLVSLGKPKKEYAAAYGAVAAAQKEAAASIRPGVPVSRLADLAQKVLQDHGYGRETESPSPAVGHSQGLDAWELPRISGDEKITIRPGMRFNLHPSVALPDGAKITSCRSYLSTEGEPELLSGPPEEIIVI